MSRQSHHVLDPLPTGTGSLASVDPDTDSRMQLGFWLYLMTDCLLFASLFATFMVLRGNTAGGVSISDITQLSYVFAETLILIFSSLMCGLGLLKARAGDVRWALRYFVFAGILGATFLGMELYEFSHLVQEGHSWTKRAYLTSYFGLVGTHGLHIVVGLVWLIATVVFMARRGVTDRLLQRLTMFTLFWHFLDIVWVCIFTLVYLAGVAG